MASKIPNSGLQNDRLVINVTLPLQIQSDDVALGQAASAVLGKSITLSLSSADLITALAGITLCTINGQAIKVGGSFTV